MTPRTICSYFSARLRPVPCSARWAAAAAQVLPPLAEIDATTAQAVLTAKRRLMAADSDYSQTD